MDELKYSDHLMAVMRSLRSVRQIIGTMRSVLEPKHAHWLNDLSEQVALVQTVLKIEHVKEVERESED